MTAQGPIIPGGISCRELVELVTAYLDGALDASVRAAGGPPAALHRRAPSTSIRSGRPPAAPRSATAELELRPDRDALLSAFREFKAR